MSPESVQCVFCSVINFEIMYIWSVINFKNIYV
jgi:hypothetical protein